MRRYWNGVDQDNRPGLPKSVDRSIPYWALFDGGHDDLEAFVGADLAGSYAAEVMFRDCPGSKYQVSYANDVEVFVPRVEFWHVLSGLAGASRRQRIDPGLGLVRTLHDEYVERVKPRWDLGAGWDPIADLRSRPSKMRVKPSISYLDTWSRIVMLRPLIAAGLDEEARRVIECVRDHPHFGSIQEVGDDHLVVDWLTEDDPREVLYSMWLSVVDECGTPAEKLGIPSEATRASPMQPAIESRQLRDTPLVRRNDGVIEISFDDIADMDDERDHFDRLVDADGRFGEVEAEDREYMVVGWLTAADPDAAVQQLWSEAKRLAQNT